MSADREYVDKAEFRVLHERIEPLPSRPSPSFTAEEVASVGKTLRVLRTLRQAGAEPPSDEAIAAWKAVRLWAEENGLADKATRSDKANEALSQAEPVGVPSPAPTLTLEDVLADLRSCVQNIECQCIDPPSDEQHEDFNAHSQYCPLYLYGYIGKLQGLASAPLPVSRPQGAAPAASWQPSAKMIRLLHYNVNVLQHREGGKVPACDGPDCVFCLKLADWLRAVGFWNAALASSLSHEVAVPAAPPTPERE